MNEKIKEVIELLKSKLISLPRLWDGKQCILELKDANYNWKQMEWWAFYFEYKCIKILQNEFKIQGSKFGNVKFDLTRNIN